MKMNFCFVKVSNESTSSNYAFKLYIKHLGSEDEYLYELTDFDESLFSIRVFILIFSGNNSTK